MTHAHVLKPRKEPDRLSLAGWLRTSVVLIGGALLLGAGLARQGLQADSARPLASAAANLQIANLTAELDAVKGNLVVNDLKLERLTKVAEYSTVYQLPHDVAARIYDAALAEGIHPSIGYQLVKVESQFKPRARSPSGALGYTQVLLRTARGVQPGITERQLLDPDQNLRMGFRILKTLLVQFEHDLELALRAYNLGPTGAVLSLSDTTTAAIGASYAGKVMRGIKREATRTN
jgi:soluble lytic murein transglycosylase-like protein